MKVVCSFCRCSPCRPICPALHGWNMDDWAIHALDTDETVELEEDDFEIVDN
jgi:hypothetical protein